MTKHAPPTPDTPFARFKATYTPLYRTLLVLGFFAALLSLAGLSNIRTIINHFDSDIFYAGSGVLTALVVPALMIASLILLWHKHPTGIKLRLAGYTVSISAAVLGFFTSQETLNRITRDVMESAKQNGQDVLSIETASSITEASFYGALYLSIAASLLFAWLWWKAWKKQQKADKKKENQKNI